MQAICAGYNSSKSFRIDGVFLPQNVAVPIYFVEVQFQKDVGFYSRFLTEIFMYLNMDMLSVSHSWRKKTVTFSLRHFFPVESLRGNTIWRDEMNNSQETDLINSLEEDEWNSVPDLSSMKERLLSAATETALKDYRKANQ